MVVFSFFINLFKAVLILQPDSTNGLQVDTQSNYTQIISNINLNELDESFNQIVRTLSGGKPPIKIVTQEQWYNCMLRTKLN